MGVCCFIDVSEPSRNFILESSFDNNGDGQGVGTLYCQKGEIKFDSINISNTFNHHYGISRFENQSKNSLIQLSTFYNNTQNDIGYSVVYILNFEIINYRFESCNLVKNSGNFVIWEEGNSSVIANDCSFQGNVLKNSNYFGNNVTCNSCYFDFQRTITGTINNPIYKSYTLSFPRLSKEFCYEIDSTNIENHKFDNFWPRSFCNHNHLLYMHSLLILLALQF